MKIQRREFKHPDGFFTTEMKKTWPWGDVQATKVWYAKTKSEVRKEAEEFVNKIGRERLVSINEYASDKEYGEKQVLHIVVWYWCD